jgi:hypothetical protein
VHSVFLLHLSFQFCKYNFNNYAFVVTEAAHENPEVDKPDNTTTVSTAEANSSQKPDPELPNELPVQLKVWKYLVLYLLF